MKKVEITDDYLIECHNKAIRNWANQNGLQYDEIISDYNSHYFKIYRGNQHEHISVRVSNHPKKQGSMNTLEYRVDMMSKIRFNKQKQMAKVSNCLSSALRRLNMFVLRNALENIKVKEN